MGGISDGLRQQAVGFADKAAETLNPPSGAPMPGMPAMERSEQAQAYATAARELMQASMLAFQQEQLTAAEPPSDSEYAEAARDMGDVLMELWELFHGADSSEQSRRIAQRIRVVLERHGMEFPAA